MEVVEVGGAVELGDVVHSEGCGGGAGGGRRGFWVFVELELGEFRLFSPLFDVFDDGFADFRDVFGVVVVVEGVGGVEVEEVAGFGGAGDEVVGFDGFEVAEEGGVERGEEQGGDGVEQAGGDDDGEQRGGRGGGFLGGGFEELGEDGEDGLAEQVGLAVDLVHIIDALVAGDQNEQILRHHLHLPGDLQRSLHSQHTDLLPIEHQIQL